MARPTALPFTQESADKIKALAKSDPTLGPSAIAAILRTDRRRLKQVCEHFGVVIKGGYKRHGITDRPIVNELFEELERQGITQKELTFQLGRSPSFIYGIRTGQSNPNLFDLECLAQIAGMRLTAVKVDTGASDV